MIRECHLSDYEYISGKQERRDVYVYGCCAATFTIVFAHTAKGITEVPKRDVAGNIIPII